MSEDSSAPSPEPASNVIIPPVPPPARPGAPVIPPSMPAPIAPSSEEIPPPGPTTAASMFAEEAQTLVPTGSAPLIVPPPPAPAVIPPPPALIEEEAGKPEPESTEVELPEESGDDVPPPPEVGSAVSEPELAPVPELPESSEPEPEAEAPSDGPQPLPFPFKKVAPVEKPVSPVKAAVPFTAESVAAPATPAIPPQAPAKKKPSSITGPVFVRPAPLPQAPPDQLLRHVVRRTLGEQMPGRTLFDPPAPPVRLRWKLQAFFTGRSFNDVVLEKTRRFRIEEVYLLRQETLTLVSYASRDPVRHAYPRKVDYDLRRLRHEVNAALQNNVDDFLLPSHRKVHLTKGDRTILVAVMRGETNLLLGSDLGFILRRIEHLVGKRVEDEGVHFTFPLQPLLEECLLVQAIGAQP